MVAWRFNRSWSSESRLFCGAPRIFHVLPGTRRTDFGDPSISALVRFSPEKLPGLFNARNSVIWKLQRISYYESWISMVWYTTFLDQSTMLLNIESNFFASKETLWKNGTSLTTLWFWNPWEVISAIFVEKTMMAAVKDEKVEKAKRLLDENLWVTRCLVKRIMYLLRKCPNLLRFCSFLVNPSTKK